MGCPAVQWPYSSPAPRTHSRYAYHAMVTQCCCRIELLKRSGGPMPFSCAHQLC
jgi:hypothetical protein